MEAWTLPVEREMGGGETGGGSGDGGGGDGGGASGGDGGGGDGGAGDGGGDGGAGDGGDGGGDGGGGDGGAGDGGGNDDGGAGDDGGSGDGGGGGGNGTVKKYAVLSGISDYGSSPLSFCDEDATDWYNYLKGLGYEITILGHSNTSDYPQHDGVANKSALRNAVKDMMSKADDDDYVAVMFSGHGVKQGGTSCYVTAEEDLYCADELVSDLNTGSFGQVFSFFDICNSGAFGTSLKAAGFGQDSYTTTTCTIDGYGYDGNGNGQWTATFLNQGLKGQFNGQNADMSDAFSWAHGVYYPSMAWSGAIDEPLEFDGNGSSSFHLDTSGGLEVYSGRGFSDPDGAALNGMLAEELSGFHSVEIQHRDWSQVRGEDRVPRRAPVLAANAATEIQRLVNLEQGFQDEAARCVFSYSLDYLDADGNRVGQIGLCQSDTPRQDHEAVYIPYDENGEPGVRQGLIIPDAPSLIEQLEVELSR